MEKYIAISQEQFELINSRLQKIESLLGAKSNQNSEWILAKDAQTLLGVGETTLWSYRKQGLIRASKINRKLYFKRSDLESLIQKGIVS